MTSPLLVPIFIAIGAIPGALSRYHLNELSQKKLGDRFPYGTLIANLSGSLLIGFVSEIFESLGAPKELKLLVLVGFLGSYTTFSTYELETYKLFEEGKARKALLYGFGSPILGLLCAEGGATVARLLR